MAEYETLVCSKHEAFVYKIPARVSNRGYRAADWKLDEPDWTGRLRVVSKGNDLVLKLEDANTGELFAQCTLDGYPSAAMEQVLDSSRYFVIRIQDELGRCAFIGVGFRDRADSFDLLVSIQDHFKRVNRDVTMTTDESSSAAGPDGDLPSSADTAPKLDLAFKEGETIKINITTRKSTEAGARQRPPRSPVGTGGSPFLPPPPGSSSRTPGSPSRTGLPPPPSPGGNSRIAGSRTVADNDTTQAAESLETLKIDSQNSPTVKDSATDNDWVSFD